MIFLLALPFLRVFSCSFLNFLKSNTLLTASIILSFAGSSSNNVLTDSEISSCGTSPTKYVFLGFFIALYFFIIARAAACFLFLSETSFISSIVSISLRILSTLLDSIIFLLLTLFYLIVLYFYFIF